ncbi:hypothetical protein T484DRAFT_1783155, partial [Baffinella frigidus]
AVRVCEGIEYIELLVEGQSFIIHQIRKMVGLAVLCLRYNLDAKDKCGTAFSDKKVHVPTAPSVGIFLDRVLYHVHVPTAPSVGLLLDKVLYDVFNKRHEHIPKLDFADVDEIPKLDFVDVDEARAKFKEEKARAKFQEEKVLPEI